MRIDDLEQALDTGTFAPVFLEYKDGWELQLRHASAAQWEEAFGETSPSPSARGRFWLEHVIGWRGLTRAGVEVPFDRELLLKWWKLDANFRAWFVHSCQSIDTFRRQPGAAPAPGSREGQ